MMAASISASLRTGAMISTTLRRQGWKVRRSSMPSPLRNLRLRRSRHRRWARASCRSVGEFNP
jgi:hypothetical protein